MILNRNGREFYALEITTDPVVTGTWEASFDDGTTWFTATTVDGLPAWLLAGPDATVGSAIAVIASSAVRPLVRVADVPELVVRRAPVIRLAS